MGTFNGKVKSAKGVKGNSGYYETIVVIENDVNCEVDCVKVSYPANLDPSEEPVNCDYSDTQNGDRIFFNDTLTLNQSASGNTVRLFIAMVDANDQVLGTDNVSVKL